MADFIDQTFGPDGRERFNSNRPPICYLGKVVAGPNIGLPLTSSAFSQGGPNNDVPIERADVAVPAGTVLVAVTGDKIPTRFSVHPPSGRAYFDGTRAGSCTFYCFGFYSKAPAAAGSGYVDEQYDRNGKMIWDHQTVFMRPSAGNTAGRIAVPAGRVWAGVAVGFGVSDNYRTIGQNTYRRFFYTGIYTDGTGIEMRSLMVDVQKYQAGSGEEPTGTVYRGGTLFAVDVTGY